MRTRNFLLLQIKIHFSIFFTLDWKITQKYFSKKKNSLMPCVETECKQSIKKELKTQRHTATVMLAGEKSTPDSIFKNISLVKIAGNFFTFMFTLNIDFFHPLTHFYAAG